MTLSEDYSDMLRALSEEKVEYLLVGAHAVGAHGIPRATGDMDFWVAPTPQNAIAVYRALARYGAPVAQISPRDFEASGIVYQIGVPPHRIDIITSLTGLDFSSAYARAVDVVYFGFEIRVPCIEDLITNKKATGRLKDLVDVEALEHRFLKPNPD